MAVFFFWSVSPGGSLIAQRHHRRLHTTCVLRSRLRRECAANLRLTQWGNMAATPKQHGTCPRLSLSSRTDCFGQVRMSSNGRTRARFTSPAQRYSARSGDTTGAPTSLFTLRTGTQTLKPLLYMVPPPSSLHASEPTEASCGWNLIELPARTPCAKWPGWGPG